MTERASNEETKWCPRCGGLPGATKPTAPVFHGFGSPAACICAAVEKEVAAAKASPVVQFAEALVERLETAPADAFCDECGSDVGPFFHGVCEGCGGYPEPEEPYDTREEYDEAHGGES